MQLDQLVTVTLHDMHIHRHVLLRCAHDKGLHELLRLLPHFLGMGITRRLIVGAADCADEMMPVA
jgi:hypothetical protein